jgi:hypothetical protein
VFICLRFSLFNCRERKKKRKEKEIVPAGLLFSALQAPPFLTPSLSPSTIYIRLKEMNETNKQCVKNVCYVFVSSESA